MSYIKVKDLVERIFTQVATDFCDIIKKEKQEIISEFVGKIERLIEECENIERNNVKRCYVEVFWLVKLKREYQEKLQ